MHRWTCGVKGKDKEYFVFYLSLLLLATKLPLSPEVLPKSNLKSGYRVIVSVILLKQESQKQ
jgi:hypothetical protein